MGSIIGAGALDFRVRNGNGYIRPAMAAGIIKNRLKKRKKKERNARQTRREKGYGQGSRPISTARLCASPRLHLRPIDPVFARGPSVGSRPQGRLVSWRASRLDAFSGYPFQT